MKAAREVTKAFSFNVLIKLLRYFWMNIANRSGKISQNVKKKTAKWLAEPKK